MTNIKKQHKCEYKDSCIDADINFCHVTNHWGISIDICSDDCYDEDIVATWMPIKYCPFCGEKLE